MKRFSMTELLTKPATLPEIRQTQEQLSHLVLKTPVWQWQTSEITDIVGTDTTVFLKLELLQHTGSFKARGALNVMLSLDEAQLRRGVTAVSAGNHAIAVAWAAKMLGTPAKVVMFKGASPYRMQRVREIGAELIVAENVAEAFATADRIQAEEGRFFVHPFEGPLTALGTAAIGLEFYEQVGQLDAAILPIGGGGLAAGMSMAIKLCNPDCQIFGVEPEGADTMYRSFQEGKPQSLDKPRTIADSLGAPYSLPYSFGLCRQFINEVVLVSDEQMQRAMKLLFRSMKLAVEPAGAAATAALCGPLLERIRGKRVGVMVCGANIDLETFARLASV